jgi:ParB family transcriptional regulator, chromosome partitioning protein
MNKRGLGRGLGALIPDVSTLAPQDGELVLSLRIDAIQPNPHQPRREFAESELAVLGESIREQGLLQPVIVRQTGPDTYQLIAGERRWRAAARAGLERIPALLRDTRDDQMLPVALVENLLRENLNPVEEARAYTTLAQQHSWSHDAIAEKVGRSRAHVSNTIRLLELPAEILEDVSIGEISAGHARAILAAKSEEEMYRLRDVILEQGLSVREAETRTRGPEERAKRPRAPKGPNVRSVPPETRELEEKLQRVFGTPVQIHDRKGRGRVSLEYYSYDDLSRLTALLFSCKERGPFGEAR